MNNRNQREAINVNWDKAKEQRARKARDHRNKMNKLFSVETAHSIENTREYTETVKFTGDSVGEVDVIIEVIDTDTVSAASKYSDTNRYGKVALLNFASFKHPGGGFLRGALAQEESLCHESNLYNILASFSNTHYEWNYAHTNKSLYYNRALYTHNVVFRDKEFTCDVITCAAPNKKAAQKYNDVTDKENTDALHTRIKFILDIAKAEGVQILILGAFGCGAFGQDATEVARIFKKYLKNEYKCFERVIFAIPSSKNKNLELFREVFNYLEQ